MGNVFGFHCYRHEDQEIDNDTHLNKKLKPNSSANYYSQKIDPNPQNPKEENDSSFQREEEKDIINENPENIYEKELKPYVVRNYNLKKNKEDYEHHYNFSIKVSKDSSISSKIPRLTSEIKLLSKNLPVKLSNSIFIVYDDARMDVMKAAIIGSEDTPYANGIFIFDVYCDENFPIQPPKFNLMTTGNSKIRFNPNLYINGYLCLSLLGTWSGDAIEKWTVKSNLLQVLLSIQAIVMSEGVIYNEPGHQNDANTDVGKSRNLGYSNIVKLANIKYAMNGHLKAPLACFKEVIQSHFKYKKKKIIETCEQWILQEKNNGLNSLYDGLVELHNKELGMKYKTNPQLFLEDLIHETEELKKELNKIK